MSKDLDELIKNMPPERRASFENARANLRDQGAELKPNNYDPQAPPRQAERVSPSEPNLNKELLPADLSHQRPSEVQSALNERSAFETAQESQKLQQQEVTRQPEKDDDLER